MNHPRRKAVRFTMAEEEFEIELSGIESPAKAKAKPAAQVSTGGFTPVNNSATASSQSNRLLDFLATRWKSNMDAQLQREPVQDRPIGFPTRRGISLPMPNSIRGLGWAVWVDNGWNNGRRRKG